MFADGIRTSGLEILAEHRIAEGLPLCIDLIEPSRWGLDGRIERCLAALRTYGGAARSELPRLRALERELVERGWKDRKLADLKLTPLQKVGSMIGAIKSGQVDVMIMVPHIAKPLADGGSAKLLGWLNDYADGYQISVLAASGKVIQGNPDLVKRFVGAYAKGIAEFNRVMLDPKADPAEVDAIVAMIHKYVYNDQPLEKAAPSIKAGSMYLNEGARMHLTDLDRQLKWFQSEGLIPGEFKIDQVVDTSFVETY